MIEHLKDIASILQALAVVFGVGWTYWIFVHERTKFPKVNPELMITEVDLSNKERLIHIEIRLENVGRAVLRPDYAELRLRQITPVNEHVKMAIAEYRCNSDKVILWPQEDKIDWKWEPNDFEIEPGEADSLYADFIVKTEIETAQCYFYMHNAMKKSGIGWSAVKVFSLDNKGLCDG